MRPPVFTLLFCGSSFCHWVSQSSVYQLTPVMPALTPVLATGAAAALHCLGCPAPRSRILKNLGGRVASLYSSSLHSSVPSNNSTPWGTSFQPADQGELGHGQPGSSTQGALVTEGTDAQFSRLWFEAEALEFFSGL